MNEESEMKSVDYKEEIKKMLDSLSNAGTLEYLYTFIKLFVEKWGV